MSAPEVDHDHTTYYLKFTFGPRKWNGCATCWLKTFLPSVEWHSVCSNQGVRSGESIIQSLVTPTVPITENTVQMPDTCIVSTESLNTDKVITGSGEHSVKRNSRSCPKSTNRSKRQTKTNSNAQLEDFSPVRSRSRIRNYSAGNNCSDSRSRSRGKENNKRGRAQRRRNRK